MALGAYTVVGRGKVLAGAAKEQMHAFIRWVNAQMPEGHRILWSQPGHDFVFYVGHLYAKADGFTHSHQWRNVKREVHGKGFKITIHIDRRAICNPFALTEVLVHELRHASDYEWSEMLRRGTDAFRDYYSKSKGMVRGSDDPAVINRRAEARAERAVLAFRRDVRETEIMRAYDRIFTPEVLEQMCPLHIRLRSALRRVGR